MNRDLIEKTANDIAYGENANDISYEDIVFFSLAEGGAMGTPGEVIIAEKKNDTVKWNVLNTLTIPHEALLAIYPPLETFDCGFGRASGIQDGWNYVDLGCGNHLLVRNDYYEAFINAVSELHVKYPDEIYANWRGIAQLLLQNYVTESKAFEMLKSILDEIDKIEYPEIYSAISTNLDMKNKCVYDDAFNIAEQLHSSDETKPLPKAVANFMLTVYEGEMNCGNANAACNIGSLYSTGRGGELNYSKAIKYYTIATDGGCRQAQEKLGFCYYYGRSTEVDYKKAFHYFALGAFDGHVSSLYKIGDMYRNGYYVEKNEREAFYVYCRCASTIHEDTLPFDRASVMMRMGDCYFEGIGTEIDYKSALEYYQKAERIFYEFLTEGDFMIIYYYEKVIKRQAEIREFLYESLPDFNWVK